MLPMVSFVISFGNTKLISWNFSKPKKGETRGWANLVKEKHPATAGTSRKPECRIR